MRIIASGRSTGKTMQLIKESALTGRYILVRNHAYAQSIFRLGQHMKLLIPFPVTVSEMKRGRLMVTSLKRDGILVDNAELVLQQLLGVNINVLTISVEEEAQYEDGKKSI